LVLGGGTGFLVAALDLFRSAFWQRSPVPIAASQIRAPEWVGPDSPVPPTGGPAGEEHEMTKAKGTRALGSAPAETSTIAGLTKKVVTNKVANKKSSGATGPATNVTTKSATKASQAKSAAEVAPTKSATKAAPATKEPVPETPATEKLHAETPATDLPTDSDSDVAESKGAEAEAANGSAPKAQPTRPTVGPYAGEAAFLDEQRVLLEAERAIYQEQATDLKAEADSLAQEREPGDVQFDEESGEGGTVTVDRERDLALSAQARVVIEEIDDALSRIDDKTYGACERCFQPIPKARLRALPYARLCVACKSGGLSRR